MRTPLTAGLVGLGARGTSLLDTLGQLPQVEVRWLCDVSPSRQAWLRRRAPCARLALDVAEMLEDDDLDAVVIATPAADRCEFAHRALLAHKHVLVAGSLGPRTSTAEELASLASQLDRRLVVAHPLVSHPASRRLGTLLGEGRLGELFNLHGERRGISDDHLEDGLILGLAPDLVALALHLIGDEPIDVLVRTECYLEPDVSDIVFAHLRFATGITFDLHLTSSLDPARASRVTVLGSRGAAVLDELEPLFPLSVHEKASQRTGPHPGRRSSTRMSAYRMPDVDAALASCKQFVTSVRTRSDASASAHLAVEVSRVLEALCREIEREATPAEHAPGRLAPVLRFPEDAAGVNQDVV